MTSLAIRTPDELEAELNRWRREQETAAERRANAARYARDPLLWIDDSVWFASPFEDDEQAETLRPVKATLFPGQRDLLGSWIDLERLKASGELAFGNVLDEKSRQIGCTWAIAAALRWLLAYSQANGVYIHESQAEVVDAGWTPDSAFGRVKYIDEHLDAIALPPGATVEYRPPSAGRAYLICAATGARVRGEVRRDNPGRGTTLDFAIVDEAPHIEHGELVHASLDDACRHGKLYMGTVNGDSNFHARLCDQRPKGWRYLRQHWSEHPIYGRGAHIAGREPETCEACAANEAEIPWSHADPLPHRYPGRLTSPWYDQAVVGKTDEQVAGELDINRSGALSARVYPEFETAVHVVSEGIEIDPAIPLELFFDFGLDVAVCGVLQNTPYSVDVVGIVKGGDLTEGSAGHAADFGPAIRAYLAELGLEGADVDEQVTLGLRAIGDPSEQDRSRAKGVPLIAEWRRAGFAIDAPMRGLPVMTTVTAVKLLLGGKPKPLRVCGLKAGEFARDMLNNVWPTDAAGNRRLAATTPLDNVHNHACRAFAYWAVATYPPAGRGRTKVTSPTRSRRRLPRAGAAARR